MKFFDRFPLPLVGLGLLGLAVVAGLLIGQDPFNGLLISLVLLAGLIGFYSLRQPLVLVLLGLATIGLGQIGRIPPLSGNLVMIDLIMGGFFVVAFLYAVANRIPVPRTPFHLFWLGFLSIAAVVLILSPLALTSADLLKNSFYLVRLVVYSSLFWFIPMLAQPKLWQTRLYSGTVWVGLAVVILGFLQLLIFPDIGFLASYGWDPHIGRLVSTFLDPNYLGGFLAIILAMISSRFLGEPEKHGLPWLTIILILVAAVLTYSRSGYLAVAIVIFLFGLRYSWKLLLVATLCLTPIVLSVPRIQERIAGGFSIDGTSQARIQSWQDALSIIANFPLTGVGYNNYQQAQVDLGIIGRTTTGHSVNGSDSSLLNVQATTGVVGFGLFVAAILSLIMVAKRLIRQKQKGVQLSAAYAFLLIAPAMLVHSMFVNSLFYPFLLLPLCVLAGLIMIDKDNL